jgi:hypothetical protein
MFGGFAMVRFLVTCQWDEEAQVWYVVESNVPGLSAEAASTEEMSELLLHLVPELMQLNSPEMCGDRRDEVPVDLHFLQSRKTLQVHCQ